jgi:hypothetical protein
MYRTRPIWRSKFELNRPYSASHCTRRSLHRSRHLAFLRCGGASPPAATLSRKTHVAHRRIKIERVYRPYLTATEAAPGVLGSSLQLGDRLASTATATVPTT